jgi:hypothetical protein
MLGFEIRELARKLTICHSSHGGECGERIAQVKDAKLRLQERTKLASLTELNLPRQ